MSFDKEAWKKGQTTTGKWSVYKDWKIDSSPTSSHLGKANIPKAAGPASGNFKAEAKEYTINKDEAIIYLILENTKTGETEDESNAPKDTCTIVGIEGYMSGRALTGNPRRALVKVDAIGHPAIMGDITNANVKFNVTTTPDNPYDWATSGNTCIDYEYFWNLDGTYKANVTVATTLEFGGFNFKAKGRFVNGNIGEVPFE